MDEYKILKKKRRKNGFTTTALLVSLSVVIFTLAGIVLFLGKTNVTTADNKNSNGTVTEVANNKCDCNNATCLRKEQVFNENLRTIKDAAVSYFTNERLPQKVGEKVKITLKKMQDEKLVLSVLDGSGKACDGTESYVEVTKEKNEYVMKINLSCSDMKDYIIVHLGCYDYCKDNVCEKQNSKGETEFEYEYKKTVACTMTDWSNWGEWTTKRETTSSNKKEDTKVETTTETRVETINATKNPDTYSCPKDYTLNNENKCVKKYQEKETIDATKDPDSYTCPEGYTINGKKCERMVDKVETIDATKDPDTYSCPTGYTLNGTKCNRTVTKTETKDATKKVGEYTCPSGYTLNGTTCTRSYTERETIKATPVYKTKTQEYTCYEEQCTTKLVLDCSGDSCGFVDIDTCETVEKTCTKNVRYVSYYTCPDGYLRDGSSCYRTVTKTDTKTATKNPDTYTCPKNYTLNGTKCTRDYQEEESIDATKNKETYSCKSGYTQDGKKCNRNYQEKETINAKKDPDSYTCKNGYALNGTKCERMVDKTDTKDSTKHEGAYVCKDGYKLTNDNKCTRNVNQEIKTTYYRYATRSCVGGSTDTKWSKSQNDSDLLKDGYKLTGNKKALKTA